MYDKNWSDCENYQLNCLADYDPVAVQCYTVPLRGQRKSHISITMISFRRHDLSQEVYLVDCPAMSNQIEPFPVNVRNVGILATQPNLVRIVQIALVNHVHVPTVMTPIMYFILAALHISSG